MRAGGRSVHLVGSYDLVFESQMKEVYDLLVLVALIGEEVLHRVNIIWVPLQLEALGVRLRTRPECLLPVELPVEQVVDALVVQLHVGDIQCQLPMRSFSFHSTDLRQEQASTALNQPLIL